jgi:lipopolysaccharide/colanic/teichoic acid biosynthesis glycosyltransferase
MSSSARRRILAALVAVDALGVALAFGAAYWLRIASNLLPERAFEEFPVYLRVSLLIIPIWLAIFAANHLYDVRYALGGLDLYVQIAKACIYGIVAVIMLSYWVRVATLSRGWLVLAWLFGVIFVGGGRFLFRRAIYELRRRGYLHVRALIVGANEQGRAMARQFGAAPRAGVEVVGFIDDFLPTGALVTLEDTGTEPHASSTAPGTESLRVLGGPDRLLDVVRSYGVSEVVVVTNAIAWETFQEIIHAARGSVDGDELPIEIKLSPGFYEILTTGVRVTQEAFVPLLLVNRQRITGLDALLKGVLDYSLSLVTLTLALPFLALIGVTLRLVSAGEVIDRHEVLASGGGAFTTWKFHTGLGHTPRPLFAHPLSDRLDLTAGGAATAAAPAEHVTGLQRFLYDTGLDKLPQVLNILRGEMSWVGPRTVSLGQVDVHSTWLPNLLTVKPGLTGPWAVGEQRSLDEEMRLTMYYIRNWTIWLDVQILAQTARRVLRLERAKAQLPER